MVIGEASGEHHRHERVTNLKVGDKFKEGDSLGHNNSWFMPDPFNPGQVAWKGGKVVRVALVEVPDTYEDSLGMSRKILDEFITPYIRPRRTSLGIEQNLVLNVKVGDEVDYDQILCEIEDPHVSSIGEDSMISTSVNKLGIKQIRAPVHGKIIRIEAVYNADLDDMSEGLRKVVANLEKQRVKEAKHDSLKAKSGRISNVNVSRPMVLPGRVLITFFIESRDPSTSADKYVVGNQMKGTVGTVLATPIYTEDGREVDVIQSFKGVFARMVLSIRDKLAAGEYATGITKQALEIYRGKK